MSARFKIVGWLSALSLCLAACAGAPPAPAERPRSVTAASAETPAVPPSASPAAVSLKEASRRAALRLEELERRRSAPPRGEAPDTGEIAQRYDALLERPGTPEERKPEILLRLAELAFREEEAALRQAYEAGEEPAVPPGARYTRSVEYYERLARDYPDTPQALTAFYNLGYLLAEEGDTERSAWAYGEVLRRDPATPYAHEIHMRLGEAAFDAGRVEEAIPHYRAVVEGGRPEYADKALYKLGWCFFNLEDYGQAAGAFARVMARAESSPEDLRRETLDILSKALLEWGGLPALERYLLDRPDAQAYRDRLYLLLGNLYLDSSRYPEAVAVFEAGVDVVPDSPHDLAMERGLLQAHLVLRDPDAANARRETWADRYGPGSAWDRANGAGPLAGERDGMVEEGLRLAALYHHGRAQRGHGGLTKALELYDRYGRLFGAAREEGYEVAYARAQGLKEAGRLEEAAAAYRSVADHPEFAAHREDASYRRIEVLEELYRGDSAWLDEFAEAHEEYARRNPDSTLVPEVLFAEAEVLFEAGRFSDSRQVFARVSAAHPEHALGRQALERVARCLFREEDYGEAEAAARRALTARLPADSVEAATKLVWFSIFKQGEVLEAAGDREGANGHFLRLADEFPGADSAQLALYRAAENLRALGREAEAARVYERVARAYRGSEYARSALSLSARLFASVGDWAQAGESYEDLYRNDPEGTEARDALYLGARARERAGQWAAAARLYGEYAARFTEDPRRAEALFREGEALRSGGDEDGARRRYAAAWSQADEGDGAVFRARAALALGKLALEAFRAVELRGDLEQALTRKESRLEAALAHLAQAASLPYAETLTEALFRAGEAFEHMKQALLASERPAGLTPEELEEYDFLLEEKAFPLEERAVGYYRKGVGAAQQAGVYTEWMDRIFERLEALVPWAYQRSEETVLAWRSPDAPPPAAGGAP